MSDRLFEKAAVVTGGGRGLGAAVAEALAAEGASVVVNDTGVKQDGSGGTTSPADEVVRKITQAGGTAIANADSVAEWDSAKDIIDSCIGEFGKIDILVNCAAILRDKMFHNMTEDDWDAVIKVHLKGTFNMMRHAAPHMRGQRSGRIINFISAGWLGTVGQANYAAAKGGIVSLTYTTALELGPRGVTVNAMAPGAKTRMTMNPVVEAGMKKKYEAGLMSEEDYNKFISIPGPEYVAPAVVYLCTEKAADINGQIIGAMGGQMSLFSKPEEVRYIYKKGMWNLDELFEMVPNTLTKGLANPAPPKESKP